MAKKTKTLRDFSKGLNTEVAPTDIDDKNLGRSVGISTERPGVIRPLGKANIESLSQDSNSIPIFPYRLTDDNGRLIDIVTGASGHQDPGHGLFSFSYGYNFGERSVITEVNSAHTRNTLNTYITIKDNIVNSSSDSDINKVNFAAGDIVRIYGKTSHTELNHRYYKISSVNHASKRVYLKVLESGTEKEFCLNDEANNRVAAALINPGFTKTGGALTTGTTTFTASSSYFSARQFFAKGDYIKIDNETMKVDSVLQDTNTNCLTVTRADSPATHTASTKIYKYTHGIAHVTDVEDGYVEKVPQRNFTKYIAGQNSEFVNLFINDTTNKRLSTTFLREKLVDMKNTHDSEETAASIGMDDFGPSSQSWPEKGMMPEMSFGFNALRVSPANKIGYDDTSYSPRWLGHINRNTLFGENSSNTYINEWYYDTTGIKKPCVADSSHSYRYTFLGYQSDYAKKNILGIPWGSNWFSRYYLNGNDTQDEVSALTSMYEVDFYEQENLEDASENIIQEEVLNSDNLYNISNGHSALLDNPISNSPFRDYQHYATPKQPNELPDGGTDAQGNATYLSDERSHLKISENLWKRTYLKIGRIFDNSTINTITSSSFELKGTLFSTKSNSYHVGQWILVDSTSQNRRTIFQIIEIKTDYENAVRLTVRGGRGYDEAYGTEDHENNPTYFLNFLKDDFIYDIGRAKRTRPFASSELLKNTGGKGYIGAYTFSRSFIDAESLDNNGRVGKLAWLGINGLSRGAHFKKQVITLNHDSSSDEAAGAFGFAIASIVLSGDTATITTDNNHGLVSGDRVSITGSTNFNKSGPINKTGDKTFTLFHVDFTGAANESTGTALWNRDARGYPQNIITKDETLDQQNFIFFSGAQCQPDSSFYGTNVAKNIMRPNTDYLVTFTCRNFYSPSDAVFMLTLAQDPYSEVFKNRWQTGNVDEREYHIIDTNSYKTTVMLRTPPEINQNTDTYMILHCAVIDTSTYTDQFGTGAPTTNTGNSIGADNSSSNIARRTMLGDFSVSPVQAYYPRTTHDLYDNNGSNIVATSYETTRQTVEPAGFLHIGFQKYRQQTTNWSIGGKAYDFYLTYLFDGGQTPQESTPTFIKKVSVNENNSGGESFRFSVSLCYSSLGDVLDMYNKRMIGARLYFKESELQESSSLYNLLDIDFVKGVRKSSNENFVSWEPDFTNSIQIANHPISGQHPYSRDTTYVEYHNENSRPYKQVKPADEGSHVYGYFKFDAPPSVLEYSTLNSSNPFEKGDFFCQYKTSTILKGKNYVGNVSIRPKGVSRNLNINSKDYENYPNGIIASEEGCFDKFPFESGWVNLPIESESSPIIKLESYLDFLIIHKESSTFILDFKEENNPKLLVSLTTVGIKWKCQSVVTNVGVFWINKTGCYHFDGKSIKNLIKGKISQDSLGWPNNDQNLYYWDIEANNLQIPSIGYDEINNQILIIANSRVTEFNNGPLLQQKDSYIWIYDLESSCWTTDKNSTHKPSSFFLSPFGNQQSGYRSNMINDGNHNVSFIQKKNISDLSNLAKWSNTLYSTELANHTTGEIGLIGDSRIFEFQTKELDFGNPHTQKKIHQIFITYRIDTSVGGIGETIDTEIEYSVDGGSYGAGINTSASDNFTDSFSNTSGDWAIASLVPTTAITCFTFGLRVNSGTASVPFNFEINDITFVYREKRIKTKVRA